MAAVKWVALSLSAFWAAAFAFLGDWRAAVLSGIFCLLYLAHTKVTPPTA